MTVPVQTPQPQPDPATPANSQPSPDQMFETIRNAALQRQGLQSTEGESPDEMQQIKRTLAMQQIRAQFDDAEKGIKELLPNMSREDFAQFMLALKVEDNAVDGAKILIEAIRKNDEVQQSKDDATDKSLSVEGNPTGGNRNNNNPPADMYEATDRIKARFR